MVRRVLALTAFAVLTLTAPAVAQVQLPPAPVPKPAPTVIDPKIAEFARTYAEVNALKEEFAASYARIHDPEGRKAAREEYNSKLDTIIKNHGMTREQYDEMIFKVATDTLFMPQFEAALKTANGG
jgi:hypothetical protein